MICHNCPYYTVLIEDDDSCDVIPWCLLADDALPDDCHWPFDCIVPNYREQMSNRDEEEDEYDG